MSYYYDCLICGQVKRRRNPLPRGAAIVCCWNRNIQVLFDQADKYLRLAKVARSKKKQRQFRNKANRALRRAA